MKAIDFETHQVQPGLGAPPAVCFSEADATSERLLLYREGLVRLKEILRGTEKIAGAHIAYDFGVACAADPAFLPLVFAAYDAERVHDVLISQAIHAIARGHFLKDPVTGESMKSPSKATGKLKFTNRYNLWLIVKQVLGREDAKVNSFWQRRYALLERKPIAEWPDEATQYPKDDVRNTEDAARYQLDPADPHENLNHLPLNCYAAWALHLGALHGVRTSRERVEALEKKWTVKRDAAQAEFREIGLFAPNKKGEIKENGPLLSRMVASAYGATALCLVCAGSAKVLSPKTGKPIQCKECGASGLDLEKEPRERGTWVSRCGVPLTLGGGVSCGADTLAESGDEILERYGELTSLVDKAFGTYLPFLRQGVDRPIVLEPNVTVETMRTSYTGVIQLFPRSGGFRECIIAPPGRVFCSVDYSAIEMSTLAEVCLELFGWSKLAEAINAGYDIHTLFASEMVGVPYEQLLAQVKAGDKTSKNYRQSTKAANFGFPGFMGAGKLVVTKRKEGLRFCIALGKAPTCETCGGKAGNLKCRICHGRGFVCGVRKRREWKGRPLPPSCTTCLELAEDLRKKWFSMWPEMQLYFDWVKGLLNDSDEDGARLVSPVTGFVRGGLGLNAANHPFQHLAAYGAKKALVALSREAYLDESSPLFKVGARFPIFAHDESISDMAWNEHTTAAAYRKAEIMVREMKSVVRRVDVKAEPALMRAWYKDAEKVTDAQGQLVPWEPPQKKAA